jgi:hypothetical protein
MMKVMKKILIFLLLIINIYGVIAQTASTDPHWTKNNTFSDEFDGSMKDIWQDLTGTGQSWGSETFRPQNIQFGSEGTRSFLRLVANMENGIPYTGGMWTGFEVGYLGLGYGYYEIEARVLQTPNIVSGLWPAFWLQHEGKNPPPYWYEELDIFEPNNCQMRRYEHVVGYRKLDTSNPGEPLKDEYIKRNVDMSQWHKYAVEWLEGRVTFYLDDEPFFVISGRPTPYHQNTNLRIDLQTDYFNQPNWYCPPKIDNGTLGCYDVNYFRYYQLKCSNAVVNEIPNFNEYCYAVKKSITLSGATTIPAGENIILRATDFIELKPGFEVPPNTELYLGISPCSGSYFPCPVIREGENEE